MGMSAGSGKGVKSEINVTPLVDVVLVLLIIFMVVTPMLQNGKDVRLPKSTFSEKEVKDADPMFLSITKDKKTFLDKDEYDDEHLEKALRGKLELKPGRKLLLKGDDSLVFSDVRRVMNVARKAGSKGISLGVEEIKK